MTLLHILDLLSVFVFALVGARVAADRGLDYGGIALVAIVASVSGGTLRNIFLGLKPILITDPWVIGSIVAAVAITLSVRRVTKIGKTLLIMDTLGLAIATASGVQLALNVEASVATIIGGVVVVLVRMLSIQFNLNLPKFKQEQT